jgi:ATP-binding cassette subfamily B multidrug efflux pump
MDNLLEFTEDDDEILSCYTLISKQNLTEKEYNKYLKQYPEIQNQDLYVLNKINKNQLDNLNNIIAEPFLISYTITNDEMSAKIKEQLITNAPEEQKEMLSQMTVIQLLNVMPQEQKQIIISQVKSKIEQNLGGMVNQAAITATKSEYKAVGMDLDSLQNKYIIITGLKMLGIALASMACAVVIMLFSSKVAAKLGKLLRDKVFKKVLSFSKTEFTKFSTASLITRSTNDIQQIQNLITMLFRVVIYAPIMGVGGFIMVLTKSDASMAYIIGITVLAIISIVAILFAVAMPKFKKLQDLIDKINLVTREILTGLPVIRAFNTEKREEKRFDGANKDLMKANIFVNRAMSIMMPMMMLIMNSVMIVIIWVGGHKVSEGIMQVGDMMAFIQYTMQIVISFLMISIVSIMIPRAGISAKRINEVIETEPTIKDNKITKQFWDDKKGYVEFKDVSFRYPDADTEILTDISFIAKPGETTAIVGSTGSGKSTIVNLIPRFYDVTGGELLVDGVNIKDVSQNELRSKIGFVPQKGILLSGTIESNIKYGNESMSDESMIRAANISQATEFIETKEDKFKQQISQGGSNVSGGQKQRLSIARAIAINPEILVFDDSFSALDFKTDSKLREELSERLKDKTVIIVAQRISTVLNADQIIVLEEGKMVGKGTHKELMQNCETYIQIATSQLSREELENGRK